jgi:hypothetical protein
MAYLLIVSNNQDLVNKPHEANGRVIAVTQDVDSAIEAFHYFSQYYKYMRLENWGSPSNDSMTLEEWLNQMYDYFNDDIGAYEKSRMKKMIEAMPVGGLYSWGSASIE